MKKTIPLYLAIVLLCHINHAIAHESTTPTLSPEFKLHIPILYYNAPTSSEPLWVWADLELVPSDDGFLFKATDYGFLDSDPNKTETPTDTTTPTDTPTGDEDEPAEFAGTVEAHNVWRRQVGVPDLTWFSDAAAVAQAWADDLKNRGCAIEHNPNRGNYGENVYWAFGTEPTPKDVVDAWGNEINDYDYATNSCNSGKICGHYTQIVWRDTTEVGCGKASCDSEQVWVCNYSPPGNYIGQKPY